MSLSDEPIMRSLAAQSAIRDPSLWDYDAQTDTYTLRGHNLCVAGQAVAAIGDPQLEAAMLWTITGSADASSEARTGHEASR
jgi:hypothetical protein